MASRYPFFNILLPLILMILALAPARVEAQTWQWGRDAGGSGRDLVGGVDIDSAGNSYVIGTFEGNVAFGSTIFTNGANVGLFLAKYDAVGALQWVIAGTGVGAGGGDFRDPSVAVTDVGDIYISGGFSGAMQIDSDTLVSTGGFDGFVARLTTNGSVQWMVQMKGGGDVFPRGVAVDRFGNCSVGGYFTGTALFNNTPINSAGGNDVFVARYVPSGGFHNVVRGGSAGNDQAYRIGVDGSGNSVVVGEFSGSVTYGLNNLVSAGGSDVFVAKFNSIGESLLGRRAGGPGADQALGVAVDQFGNAYVTGTFSDTAFFGDSILMSQGETDVFIMKVDGGARISWGVRGGGGDRDAGLAITYDGLGNIYATGRYFDSASFGPVKLSDTSGNGDIFVVKYSGNGVFEWGRSAGGVLYDEGRGIAIDRNNELRVVGSFEMNATFGPVILASTGDDDLFITKLGADPSIVVGTLSERRFCAGAEFDIPYSIKGMFATGNVFTAQLSDSNGSFAAPITLGRAVNTFASIISATIPDSVPSGRRYRIRVVSSDPAVTGSPNGEDIIISASPKPVIAASGAVAFCSGDSVTLDAGTGFTSYRWNTGATTRTIVVRQGGTYTVTGTSEGGCAKASAPMQVTVYPAPPKPGIVRTGGELQTGTAASYEWSLNGTPITGATGQSYTPSQPGTYRVRVTNANGCSSISDAFEFTVSGIAMETGSEGVRIYPHPSTGLFTLELNLDRGGRIAIEVVNALGGTVARWEDMAQEGIYRRPVDITHLPAGIYFLRIDAGGRQIKERFTIYD